MNWSRLFEIAQEVEDKESALDKAEKSQKKLNVQSHDYYKLKKEHGILKHDHLKLTASNNKTKKRLNKLLEKTEELVDSQIRVKSNLRKSSKENQFLINRIKVCFGAEGLLQILATTEIDFDIEQFKKNNNL